MRNFYRIDGRTYPVKERLKRKGWRWKQGSVWEKVLPDTTPFPKNAYFEKHYPGCSVSLYQESAHGRGWCCIWVSPSHPRNEDRYEWVEGVFQKKKPAERRRRA